MESRSSGAESSEARQKFAGAKAISSDMFFGREVDTEVSRVVHTELGVAGGGKSFLPATVLGLGSEVTWPVLGHWPKASQACLVHSMKPGPGYSSSQGAVPSVHQISLGTWKEPMERVGP